MIKVDLPTRNRYITSEVGATATASVAYRPLREDGSWVVLLSGDRPGSFDRGSRRPYLGATTGGREQAAA